MTIHSQTEFTYATPLNNYADIQITSTPTTVYIRALTVTGEYEDVVEIPNDRRAQLYIGARWFKSDDEVAYMRPAGSARAIKYVLECTSRYLLRSDGRLVPTESVDHNSVAHWHSQVFGSAERLMAA